jgi:predicted ATPase
MADTIKKLTIEGFKSIRKLEDFELRPLNVLIGANGAGKSNFVGFFRLLREIIDGRLQLALATTEGGADGCLFLGPKITSLFSARLYFGSEGLVYEFDLAPTFDNRLAFVGEAMVLSEQNVTMRYSGNLESQLKGQKSVGSHLSELFLAAISSWVVYHFHDTGPSAPVRRAQPLNRDETLYQYAENLAAFLYRVQQIRPGHFRRIRDVVRLAAPFFDDFKLRPIPTRPDEIQLEWLQRDSAYPFRANQLSDGTLRFICLATALLQPDPPSTMLFDEPELGLHPYALSLLGNLFKQAADRGTQIIISTQSAQLLNEFAPEDVIVVERVDAESKFRRLNADDLKGWLEDYTLGELWQKNVLGGRPREDRSPEPVARGD